MASLNITGGSFLFFADPLDVNLFANDTTAINIFGPSFNFPFGPIAPLSGVLTGTLSDGNAVNGDFGRDSGAQIILIEVPEPGTLMLSWIGLLVLGLSRGLCGRYDP